MLSNSMQTPIYFPNLKKGSTIDCILKLLTAEPTLTNQKIFNQLKKQYNVSRSYQTIRQALLELVEDGVLVKDKKQYSISKDWIMVMDSYVSLLKRKYIENKEINIIDKNTKEIKLDSLYDLGHFILHSFREHFFDMNNENDLYMFVHHLWFPFLNKKKRDLLRDFFSKNNNNIYVGKAYFFDKILAVFYKKYGKVFLNTNFDDFFDFVRVARSSRADFFLGFDFFFFAFWVGFGCDTCFTCCGVVSCCIDCFTCGLTSIF